MFNRKLLVIFSLVLLSVLFGCGGSSGTDGSTGGSHHIAFSQDMLVGAEGADATIDDYGVTVSIPAGIFAKPQTIKILIDKTPPTSMGLPLSTLSPVQVGLRFDSSAIVGSGKVEIGIRMSQAAGAKLTFGQISRGGTIEPMLEISNDANGLKGLLPLAPGGGGSSFIAKMSADSDYWTGLAAVQDPGQFAHHSDDPRSIKVWDGHGWQNSHGVPIDLKRVALVVPGILEEIGDMDAVADRLSNLKCGGKKRYDLVLGLDYPWGRGVTNNSKDLNELIRTYTGNGPKIDVMAHSMGGLVIRDAIAFGNLSVDNFIMLGTPNGGVPMNALRSLAWQYTNPDKTIYLEGLSDLLEGSNVINSLYGSSLKTANRTYVVGGTAHEGYKAFVGSLMAFIYESLGDYYFPFDGITPFNSAIKVLGLTATASVPLNHSELVSRISEIKAIDDWLKCESDYYTTVEGAIVETGFFNILNPNVEIQNLPFSVPLGTSGSWDKSTNLQYGGDFSGESYARGSIGDDIQMHVQAEYHMVHPGGGMIRLGDVFTSNTVKVFVTDPVRKYRLDFSLAKVSISESNPNDGSPGANSQGTSGSLWVNGTRYDADVSNSIEISAAGEKQVIDGKDVYLAATISGQAKANGGFTAIIGVPPIETLGRTTLTIKAKVVPL